MTPNQPYLLRAIHEWILDNNMTPHILVNTDNPNVEVPMQSVQDGQIVLNVATHAISNIIMDNDAVSFSARFSGVVENIYIPIQSVKAIYASENGQGLVFPETEMSFEEIGEGINTDADESQESLVLEVENTAEHIESPKPKKASPKKKAPFLKIVK